MARMISAVFKRELAGYFRSPVAYVFLVVFLMASVGLAFFVGEFFKSGNATLESYFTFHPWLFLFLIPSVGMRLWSEEKRSGTIELLFTLPLTPGAAVLGKFLAAWAFLATAILLSFPMVVTVAYLGDPDLGVIAASYLGSILMAGAYLGVCSLTSALTRNQVISFVLSLLVCLILVFLGWNVFSELLTSVLPVQVVDLLANFSFTTHFQGFAKGIVDPKDVVFFLSLAGFCLALNVLVLDIQQSTRAAARVAAVALLLVALVAVNYLAAAVPLRVDATEEKVYTLSSGTRALLGKLEEPVRIELFYSRGVAGLPIAFKNYADRIHEMLRQYARVAHGKIELAVTDPRPDTPDEERATAAGLSGQPTATGESVFLGLVAIQGEQQKSIAFLSPQRESFLEYDISQLIHDVQQWNKPRVGLLTTLPLQGKFDLAAMQSGRPPPSQYVLSEWSRAFEIVTVDPTASELPPNLDALAVIHPAGLAPTLQYAIDQYVLAGKPLFLALDPASRRASAEMQSAMMMGPNGMPQQPSGPPPSSDLPDLRKAWGIEFTADQVVADTNLATPVSTRSGEVSRYPTWLSLPRDSFNRTALPTSGLDSFLAIDAGAVSARKDSGVEFTPLLETSPQAGEVDAMGILYGQLEDAARNAKTPGQKVLAALVSGKFQTAFPDGPPAAGTAKPVESKAATPAPSTGLKESRGRSTVLVVADTDWMFDDYSVRRLPFFGGGGAEPINDNLAFASNALEFLAGSPDLISLRGRSSVVRPFVVVRKMEADAQRRYQQQLDALETRIKDVQTRLTELMGKSKDGNRLVATPEVRAAIESFQKEEAGMRRERRQIRAALREGIESLGNRLLLLNLLGPPLFVAAFGFWFHHRRFHRRKATASS